MQQTLYHGTEREKALKILKDNKFTSKYKAIHYLGQGVYFYDEPSKAERWIKNYYKGTSGVILKSEISVNDLDVLDLRKETHRKRAVHIIEDTGRVHIFNPNSNDDVETNFKKLRCYLFDCISEEIKCKLIISFLVINTVLWFLSVPDEKDLQYCVKDVSIIQETTFYRDISVRRIV